MEISVKTTKDIPQEDILHLYRENNWSSAGKPDLLYQALLNSSLLVSAWDGARLVGLGSAISDGYLVVYYPHLLVLPAYQRKGIGRLILAKMQERYKSFHQQILVADGKAVDFYKRCGFNTAGQSQPLWIYDGKEH